MILRAVTLSVALSVSLPAAVAAAAPTPRIVTAASLQWEVNAIYQGGDQEWNSCNFFSAGVRTGFAGRDDAVRIVHRQPDGSTVSVSNGTKCQPVAGHRLGQRVLFTGGTGAADRVTGEARIRWSGAFTANAYGGMVTWWLRDPVLTVRADGTGSLTAIAGGTGADRDDPERTAPVPPREVTVATYRSVRVTASGITITPDFRGVDYFRLSGGVRETASAIPAAVKRANPGWGSWPESFVDFQYETELSSYWHTSGGGADPDKPPADIEVGFDGAPPVRELPGITTDPTATTAAPFTEGRDVTFTASADNATSVAWESAPAVSGPWVRVAGAAGASLTLKAIGPEWNGTYLRFVAVNGEGTVASVPVLVQTRAFKAMVFTAQPGAVTGIAGGPATTAFTVDGYPGLDGAASTVERSMDGGATWVAWLGARFQRSDGGGTFVLDRLPAAADGNRIRVRAVNTEGVATVSAAAPVRVFAARGANQIEVMPGPNVNPANATTLTLYGAGFAVPVAPNDHSGYSLDIGVFDATAWTPGRAGGRNWVVGSPETSRGELYRERLVASGGFFTARITIPAGVLERGHSYGIGTLLRLSDRSTWVDSFDERSADSWTPLSLTGP